MRVTNYWYDEADREWEITGTATPFSPQTFEHPAEGGEIEDIEFRSYDEDCSLSETEFIDRFGQGSLDEALNDLYQSLEDSGE